MSKALREWSETKTKFGNLVVLMAGIITTIVGYGVWRSPYLDLAHFKNAFEQLLKIFFNEIIRMVSDPFAFVGLVVLVVGLLLINSSVRNFLPD